MTVLRLDPARPGRNLASLRRLANLGGPVELEGLDALEPEPALALLEAFLHEPAFTAPVEPFSSLLSALARRREICLWDLHPSEDGSAFLLALPRDRPECMDCPGFPLCQGYAAHAGSCPTWRTLLPALALAARGIARLRAVPSGGPHAHEA